MNTNKATITKADFIVQYFLSFRDEKMNSATDILEQAERSWDLLVNCNYVNDETD